MFFKLDNDVVSFQIFGIYKLKMHAAELYFLVMENIFRTTYLHETINEMYDLKGSWVDRHAPTPRDGQLLHCRHCNQPYIYRKRYRMKHANDLE